MALVVTQLSSPAGEKVVFEAVASSGAGVTATWLKDNAQLDDKLADRLKVGKSQKTVLSLGLLASSCETLFSGTIPASF